MLYDLSTKSYDLFTPGSYKYIIPHKKATIENCAGFLQVKYDSKNSLTSAGFRVLVGSTIGKTYQLTIEAYLHLDDLNRGDKDMRAFIYCECDNNRIIPRTYFIYPGVLTQYVLDWTASSERTYIGILFYTPNHDYVLEVNEFNIEIKYN